MNKKKMAVRLVAICLVFPIFVLSAWLMSQETAEGIYEAALLRKEASGDLQGAIQLFQKILKQFPEKRDVAAKAQFQIGACYEKLGTAEAVKAYELVLKNYADQPELVAAARERLAALKRESAGGATVINIPMGAMGLWADLMPSAISPDGTKILGIGSDTGDNIVFYDLVTNQTQFITRFDWSEGSFFADSPIWSPDGKEVAFTRHPNKPGSETAEVWAAGLDGKSRLLSSHKCQDLLLRDWLRDGSTIVAVCIYKDRSGALGSLPASGGAFKILYPFEGGLFLPAQAKASPDGRYIVFDEGRLGARDLRVIGIGGGSSEILVAHPADDFNPLWSPDGRRIIFQSNRHAGDGLWGLPMKAGQASGEPFLIKDSVPGIELLNWTLQGVGYSKAIRINDIFLQSIDPQTNELVGKPRLLSHMPTGANVSPRWSPDGKYLAFASSPSSIPSELIGLLKPGQVEIVVLPLGGGKAKKFPAPIYRWHPYVDSLAWSADSSGLSFVTLAPYNDSKKNTIVKLDIATGEWKSWPLPGLGENNWTPLEWDPEGHSVFYVKQDFQEVEPGILRYDLAAGKEKYIYRLERGKGGTILNLRLSPDSRWLLFQEDLTDVSSEKKAKILALELGTGKIRTVYEGFEYAYWPAWSPDGQSFLVWCSGSELGIIPAAGGSPRKLKIDLKWPENDVFSHTIGVPDWSPDGKQIAFTVSSTKEEVFLLKDVIPANRPK